MSYENPRYIEQPDPLAFSKSFESTFSTIKGQWDAKKEEMKLAKEKADAAQAAAYNLTTLSPIQGLEEDIYTGLQTAFNNIVEGGFSSKPKSEQALVLQGVNKLKLGYDNLAKISSMTGSSWDTRNDPRLTNLRTAILSGGKDLKVQGSGEDVELVFGNEKITLKELASARVMDSSQYKSEYKQVIDEASQKVTRYMESAVRSGLNPDAVKRDIKGIIKSVVGEDADDFYSWIYANKLPIEGRTAPTFKSPDLSTMENGGEIVNQQYDSILSQMVSDIQETLPNVRSYLSAPKPPQQQAQKATGPNINQLNSEINSVLQNIPSAIYTGTGQIGQYDAKTGIYSYKTQDEKGNETLQQVSFFKEPTRAQAALGSVFDQLYSKNYDSSDRAQARNYFIQMSFAQLANQYNSLNQPVNQQGQNNQEGQMPKINAAKPIIDAMVKQGLDLNQDNADRIKKEINAGMTGSIDDIAALIKKYPNIKGTVSDYLKQKTETLRNNKFMGSFIGTGGTSLNFNMSEEGRIVDDRSLTPTMRDFFKKYGIPKTFENKDIFVNYIEKGGKLSSLKALKQGPFDQYKIQQ